MSNIVQFGIEKAYIARRYADGTYGTPVHLPGSENLAISNGDTANNEISADNGLYWGGNGANTKTGEYQNAKFPKWFYTTILGWLEENGGITEADGAAAEFAFLFQTDGDAGGERFCWFDCTCTVPTMTFATTNADGTITEASESTTITAKRVEMSDGVKRLTHRCPKGGTGYNDFFSSVPFATTHVAADTSLSALSIGSSTLSPTFSATKYQYSTSTTNVSDEVTATATASGATVAIKVNGTTINSGTAATWRTGANTVSVIVTNGVDSKETIVTVTKSA